MSSAGSVQKNAQIAEIMGLMEKLDKDKYWIIEQMGKAGVKAAVSPAMSTYEILRACPMTFISRLSRFLKGVNTEFEPPKYTKGYHWFFTDIVASANPDITTNTQTQKIIALNKLIHRTSAFRRRSAKSTIILPTGDGVAIGFADSPEKPLLLAIELHRALAEYNLDKNQRNRIDVRIGLDTGPVYPIIDLNGKKNVWGPGIIYARRIMDLGRAKSILASDRIANDIRRLRPEYGRILHALGNYPIKHGEKIMIYNVYGSIYGTEVGTKKNPLARRVEKSQAAREFGKSIAAFLFAKVEIMLDIVDAKTMMTHHTWVWHVVNKSSEPVDRVFYYLEGDVPKDFPDLNLKVTDEMGNDLQLQSLDVNKPLKKEFFVKLSRPLKPDQKGRFVKLEYDWEEPDRHFLYRFASDCKKFRFQLTAPRDLVVKQRVAKISPETGDKTYASTPATVKYMGKKTEVEWAGSDIPAFDAYRFDW